VQLVEVRLCLTVRQSLTSIVGAFLTPAGITSFGCLHIFNIHVQINNFYVDRYHPFKGCYLYELTAKQIGNLISESLYITMRAPAWEPGGKFTR